MTHELKILPRWFEDVCAQKKTFEIRKNDNVESVKNRDFSLLSTFLRMLHFSSSFSTNTSLHSSS